MPKIAKEWCPTKNGKLTAFDVNAGSAFMRGGNVKKEMIMFGKVL